VVQTLRLAVGVLLLFFLLAAHAQNTPTCSVTAEPETLTGGGQVTVTWTAEHATTCVASGGWSGPKDPAGGTQTLSVSQSRTFTLNCKAATGKVVARWTKITANTDGTPATITGYRLYIADAPSGLPSATAITLPATPLEYTFWRSPGDVSAGIKAVRSDQVDSALSNVASKSVVAAAATCADSVTVNPRPKAPSLTLTLSKLIEFFNPPSKKPNGS
jgi:hypothetical protein